MKLSLAIAISVSAALCVPGFSQGQEPAPVAAPSTFTIQSAEEKYSQEAAKAESESAKILKTAAAARLKAYKDKLVEVTKAGDFDKATGIKARIDELEQEPESQPIKRPRPKDVVKFNGHTYALIRETATWHVAKQRCDEMGGHLVCMETPKEIAFVADMCNRASLDAWVGITKEEGAWKWVTGQPATIPGAAVDNAGDIEHHIHWSTGIRNWNDGPAGWKFGYVVEWDK